MHDFFFWRPCFVCCFAYKARRLLLLLLTACMFGFKKKSGESRGGAQLKGGFKGGLEGGA